MFSREEQQKPYLLESVYVKIRRVRQNSFGFEKDPWQRRMQIIYIINTGKESGISLENWLGYDRV